MIGPNVPPRPKPVDWLQNPPPPTPPWETPTGKQPLQVKPLTDYQIKEMAMQEQLLLICDGIEELTVIVRAVEARMAQGDKP